MMLAVCLLIDVQLLTYQPRLMLSPQEYLVKGGLSADLFNLHHSQSKFLKRAIVENLSTMLIHLQQLIVVRLTSIACLHTLARPVPSV